MKSDDCTPDTPPVPPASTVASAGHAAPNASFPIVGIGASAGGLEAFEGFFRACPADSGMAFVLVSHLDPGHASLLTEILQRSTAMPVAQAIDQIAVAPDHVYIIPPNRGLAILNGVLQLSLPERARGQRLPIDAFLRSLAEDQAENAVGIILSGTASDGTLGLRAILGGGGMCMVQEPSTAKYDGMPKSAAAYATHILPVEKMPAMLLEVTRQSVFRQKVPSNAPENAVSGIAQVLLELRNVTGHDFSHYKESTMGRRIERRMVQHNIEDMAVYARYLKENLAEAQALLKELLINVSRFFRDPDAFIALKETILPPLLAGKAAGDVFRVWVAGCASGEEAYSIAMVLLELLGEITAKHEQELTIQIYATDLDDDAIAMARTGRYPPNIAQDVTQERLRCFFTKDDAGYKVKKVVRDMVVFAIQNIIKDPPFTKLDLLSCRNVMIYLEPELQNRIVPVFHYALKPNGVLFLSTAESITNHPELFSTLDRKWKFYRANHADAVAHPKIADNLLAVADKVVQRATAAAITKKQTRNIADVSNRALLQTYAPASVTTDANGDILYVHGETGGYLRPAPGPVTNNVIGMAREGLQLDLRAAILHAAANPEPTLNRKVLVKNNGGWSTVSFSVRRLPGQAAGASASDNLLLVSFHDVAEEPAPAATEGRNRRTDPPAEARRIEELEREVAYAKESLQTTIEEQQAANEELKSANEEWQSTNEELQSANEELATSREEMQSLNEETITVNSELCAKIEQLNGMQNDMNNLLESINAGTLFLDHQLVIRRYTREAVKIYRLIATDIGRPLGDIKSNIEGEDVQAELQAVLDTLIPCEREVRTIDGAWYLARIQPYRTLDNGIEGIVLTFTEVTNFKLASEAVKRSEAHLATAQEMAHLGNWELDVATGLVRWSGELFKIFGRPPVTTAMSLQDALRSLSQEDRQRVTTAIQASVDTQVPYDIEYRVTRPDGTTSDLHSRAMAITDAEGRVTRLVGTTLDITEIRDAERLKLGVVQLARELAEGIVNTVSEPLIVLDGGLQVVSASRSFYHHFRVTAQETVGRKIYDLGNGQWDIPSLRQLIEKILPHDQLMEGYVVEHVFPGLGPRRMVLNARRIVTAIGNTELILLAMVAIEPLETP